MQTQILGGGSAIFAYHYCAFRISRQTGERVYMDGIVHLTDEIKSDVIYEQFKAIVAEKHDVARSLLVITSLSKVCMLVNTEQTSQQPE